MPLYIPWKLTNNVSMYAPHSVVEKKNTKLLNGQLAHIIMRMNISKSYEWDVCEVKQPTSLFCFICFLLCIVSKL